MTAYHARIDLVVQADSEEHAHEILRMVLTEIGIDHGDILEWGFTRDHKTGRIGRPLSMEIPDECSPADILRILRGQPSKKGAQP